MEDHGDLYCFNKRNFITRCSCLSVLHSAYVTMSSDAFTINFRKTGILVYSLDTDTLHCQEENRCMGQNKNSFQNWSSSTAIDFSWNSLPQNCPQRHQQEEISTQEVHMLLLHNICCLGTEMWVHKSHIWDLPGEVACGQSRCSWWEN